MALSKETIARVAKLARLELSDKEMDELEERFNKLWAEARSMTLPAYITFTLSAYRATTPKLCVITITAVPNSLLRLAITSRI